MWVRYSRTAREPRGPLVTRAPEALLALEDGTVFRGSAFGATGETFGEAVFNTAMSGYQEVLTDPSYTGQVVAMTSPQQRNYGTNREDPESSRVRVAGFAVRHGSHASPAPPGDATAPPPAPAEAIAEVGLRLASSRLASVCSWLASSRTPPSPPK